MKALKFTLSGRTAFFKNPQVNVSTNYFTFSQIPKTNILGICGAIMGYSGYNKAKKDGYKDGYTEYYSKLKDLKIAIVPKMDKRGFKKSKHCITDTTWLNSKDGVWLESQIWLENVKWNIYIILDNAEAKKLAERIINHKHRYHIYLGKNDHFAQISNEKIVELDTLDNEKVTEIHSLVEKEKIKSMRTIHTTSYIEYLPVALEKDTGRYIYKKIMTTNSKIKVTDKDLRVYNNDNENIVFI